MRGHQSYLKQLRVSSSSSASPFLGMWKGIWAERAPFTDFSKFALILSPSRTFFLSWRQLQSRKAAWSLPPVTNVSQLAYCTWINGHYTVFAGKNRSFQRMWPQQKTAKFSESLLSEAAHSRKWSCCSAVEETLGQRGWKLPNRFSTGNWRRRISALNLFMKGRRTEQTRSFFSILCPAHWLASCCSSCQHLLWSTFYADRLTVR